MTSLMTSISSLMIPVTSTCLIRFKMVLLMDQSDLAIKLDFKNRLMSQILGISANLNDILDELDTILDDPYDRYMS